MSYASRHFKTRNKKITTERKEVMTIEQYVYGSRMLLKPNVRTDFLLPKLHAMKISVKGYLSKIPSVSNEKVLSVIKTGEGKFRAVASESLVHKRTFEGLSRLWESECRSVRYAFEETKDDRLFAIVLLSSLNDRVDSHNTTKGLCDWLQSIGLIANDKNLDILPLHKANYFRSASDVTDILICRGDRIETQLNNLIHDIELSITAKDLVDEV